MFDSRWRRAAVLVLAPAVLAGFAGCSSSGSPSAVASASAAAKQGAAAPFNTVKLRGALLTKVNGVAAAVPAVTGKYASLPEASAVNKSKRGVMVTPKACARATLTGFNANAIAGSPAAAVTFKVGGNRVSEVLVGSGDAAALTAIAGQFPRSCASYQETVDGRTFRYSVRDSAVKGIGRQAREMNVKTTGAVVNNQWSMVYRGPGFVGSVIVVGPNASELAVRQLARQAYAYAAKSLS